MLSQIRTVRTLRLGATPLARKRKRCENKSSVNPNIVCERLNGALTPWQRLPDRKMKDAMVARVPYWVSAAAAAAFLRGVFVALPGNKSTTGRKWNGIELSLLFLFIYLFCCAEVGPRVNAGRTTTGPVRLRRAERVRSHCSGSVEVIEVCRHVHGSLRVTVFCRSSVVNSNIPLRQQLLRALGFI